MAIAKKPQRYRTTIDAGAQEEAAEAFIAGAERPLSSNEADSKKVPTMIRFDRALLERVDAAAKHRGISRSAWIQFTLSRALDHGEG